MDFELDARLAQDCHAVGELPLCRLLLMNDAQYPWCILVPRRPGVREWHHLSAEDRSTLLAESCRLAEAMEQLFKPHKLNVAALGNMVPQLHVHHIARYPEDVAWPRPVWGVVPAQPYTREQREQRCRALRQALALA